LHFYSFHWLPSNPIQSREPVQQICCVALNSPSLNNIIFRPPNPIPNQNPFRPITSNPLINNSTQNGKHCQKGQSRNWKIANNRWTSPHSTKGYFSFNFGFINFLVGFPGWTWILLWIVQCEGMERKTEFWWAIPPGQSFILQIWCNPWPSCPKWNGQIGLRFGWRNLWSFYFKIIINNNFHFKIDVAVDIRPNSPTFGKWHGILLDSKEKTNFWIPDGILWEKL